MQRNLGSEVLVAVGGLGVIICGLLFALFLSNGSDRSAPTQIPSSLVSATVVAQADTETETPEATVTDEPSETSEPTATETEEPSQTPEPTVTETDEPSETPEPTATDTKVPTVTDEPTETPEPTVTDTKMPTATDEPSETPEPTVTDTKMPTATDEPSETREPTATDTKVPTSTDEPTATPTLTPSVTPTSLSSFTGIIPTLPPTPTVVPLDEPTRTPASCELPSGWTTYTVQSGDTLFAISLVTNSTVDELRFANCIDDIDNITAGDVVFVPIAPISPVSTAAPSGIRQGLVSIGCTSPTAQITNLVSGQSVSGLFTVLGTATRPDFQYYKIEVRPDFASIYNFYSRSETQVINGVLDQINADIFGPGLHWVRLSVVDIRAEIAADAICEIPVIFE